MIGTFHRIVLPLAVAQIFMWASLFYLFPALLLVWEGDFGWSKTELSGAFTLALVVSAVFSPGVGRIIDRGYGSRIFSASAIIGSLLIALLAMVTKLWQFYAVSVFRSVKFWLLAVAYTAIALDHNVLLTHLLPLLSDRGIQREAGVFAASMIGPMQVAGRLAMVAVGHRVSVLVIFIVAYISMIIAGLFLLGSGTLPGFLAGFVLFQGAGFGVMSIMRPVMTAEIFGRINFGMISGSLAAPYLGAAAAAPTIAALIYWVGGYDWVILFAIGASGLGLVSLLAAPTRSSSSNDIQ